MAVITDVGDKDDIHPTKKVPVGARLALAARAIAHAGATAILAQRGLAEADIAKLIGGNFIRVLTAVQAV